MIKPQTPAQKQLGQRLRAAREAYDRAMQPSRDALLTAENARINAKRLGHPLPSRAYMAPIIRDARRNYNAALALHRPIYLDAVHHARRRFESSARSQRPSNPPQTAKNLVCEPGEDCDHVYEVSTYSGEVEFSACVFCGYSPIK